jgi:alpha-L-fucosidase 2
LQCSFRVAKISAAPFMKPFLFPVLALLFAFGPANAELTGNTNPPNAKWILWYNKPAANWNEALPIGNGEMGAMVFGSMPGERVQFNEYTIWTGHPRSYAHRGAAAALPEIRKLLADGKQREAEALAMKDFMSEPLYQMEYQPCGDLFIDLAHAEPITNYRRWLDLDSATTITEYESGGVKYRREMIASHPDHAIFIHLTADKPGKITGKVRLTSPHKDATTAASGKDKLILRGEVEPNGISFESIAKTESNGGTVETDNNELKITGADEILIRLVAATNFVNYRDISGDPKIRASKLLENASDKPWQALVKAHAADHQALFRRMDIDLGNSDESTHTTDQRIADYSKGNDPQLAALTFQYGRYLLIASSRPGGQPSTLQGIWNESLKPAWGSKYTCNINTQMNYWPAEPTNLAECTDPLFNALGELVTSGQETAKEQYDAPGWVLHHNFDIWRGTAPINHSNHGIWPTGGAWLCHHLWEHYLFTGDLTFLREKAYPIIKGSAEFFAAYLVEDPATKTLVSGPSNSPEQGGLVMGR